MIPSNNDLRIEVTTHCNYNCCICPRDKLTRKKETMSLDIFKHLFNKVAAETNQYDTLTFPGLGEPLLDSGLVDKIRYAKSKKSDLKVLILTNGSLLTVDKFKELEDVGVTSIRVSFYANSPETYLKVHGVNDLDTFNRVKENLSSIAKIKNKTQLLLTFNIVEGINQKCVDSWVKYWKEKVDLIEVWRPHNWVDGRNCRKIQKEKLKTCGRPEQGPLQIQVDGTINMCCFDFDGKLTLGDLKTQSLKEIFNSDIFKLICQCHETGNFKNSGLICKNCDQRNIDKSDVMEYNSKFNIKERINQTSTTYLDVTK